MRASVVMAPHASQLGRCLAAVLVLLAQGNPIARADVIDSNPDEERHCDDLPCPEGSSAVALDHTACPSVCRPNAECQSATDCVGYGEGARCEPTRFCVTVQYGGHGMSEAVTDACEPTGPCGAPVDPTSDPADRPRCSEASRCVAPPAPPAPPASPAPARGGCAGCAIANDGDSGLAISLLVLFALARGRRRAHGTSRSPASAEPSP